MAFMKKLLFHLKDVYLKWHAKSSEETNYIWSSTNKVLPLLCSNGLKTEAYLEWYVKDSDSLGNRHPRVFGSRSFICIRPFKFQRELFCIFVMKWFDHKYMEKYNHPTSRDQDLLQCWHGSQSLPQCALFQGIQECASPSFLFFCICSLYDFVRFPHR